MATLAPSPAAAEQARRRKVLSASGATHFLHDGFSDVIYVLLPLWQSEFGLSLAQVGVLKASYSGALAGLQMPAGMLAERLGERLVLVVGTAITGLGFVLLGSAGGFLGLALLLLLAGGGSATQHPLNATLVAAAYPERGRRMALGIYNFTGDLGKVAVPMAAALVIAAAADWRLATTGYGLVGTALAALAFPVLRALGAGDPPPVPAGRARPPAAGWGIADRQGFAALAAVGVVDSAVRTGFLTFLPFLLRAKGADVATIGLALGLTFAGGAAGKFLCGVLAERAGILRTVVITEVVTGLGIVLLLPLPLGASLALLPVLGAALNGTSSVLYASVAEFVSAERRGRGFALFYTLGIGAGALAPFVCGLASDLVGLRATLTGLALLVLATLPLCLVLRRSVAGAGG